MELTAEHKKKIKKIVAKADKQTMTVKTVRRTLEKSLGLEKDALKPLKEELTAYVTPAFVPDGNTLAVIDDAINAVEITSENLQSSLLVGRGAGRFPTANSCVSDIVGCARKGLPEAFAKKTTDVTFMNDFSSQFYLRIQYRNEVGIVGNLGDICAKHDVSIYSLLQKPESDYFVLITEYGPRSNIKKVAAEVEGAEVLDSLCQACLERDLRLPSVQDPLGLGDVCPVLNAHYGPAFIDSQEPPLWLCTNDRDCASHQHREKLRIRIDSASMRTQHE